jgi:DNA-binding SARP family transcriptional activator
VPSTVDEDWTAIARPARLDARAALRRGAPVEQGAADLMVRTLGHTRLLRGSTEVGGQWLEQLPGQLLKLLVTFRDEMVPVERIAEALWSDEGRDVLASVRFTVHQLRKRLDVRGSGASLIVSHRGGYRLDGSRVRCDADRFTELVTSALAAAERGAGAAARADLERAMALYTGDYIGDEPYAEWLFPERERLRDLAGRALGTLACLCDEAGDLDDAARRLERLTRLEPYDEDTQRRLIELCLRRGRRSEAMRRYAMLEALLRRDLQTTPSFSLHELLVADLARAGAAQEPTPSPRALSRPATSSPTGRRPSSSSSGSRGASYGSSTPVKPVSAPWRARA